MMDGWMDGWIETDRQIGSQTKSGEIYSQDKPPELQVGRNIIH